MKHRHIKIPIGDNAENISDILKSFKEHLPYVSLSIKDAILEDGNILVVFNPDSDVLPERDVIKLFQRIASNFRFVKEEIEFENTNSLANSTDPYATLLHSGQVFESARGVFIFKGDFARVMLSLDDYFRNYALSIGAEEHVYPPLLGAREFFDSGYVESFPQNSFFVSHFDFSLDVLDDVNANADSYVEDNEKFKKSLAAPSHAISPTVCYHCFLSLKESTLKAGQHVYTAIGKCGRHESQNLSKLSRLQLFTMREIIFIGEEKYVREQLHLTEEHARHMLEKWNIKARIVSATDPFFAANAPSRQAYQSMQKLKFEMQLKLPTDETWVSCASFNNHQQSLLEKFNIQNSDEKELHSGCVGYGYERLAYALFCQFGAKISLWPEVLQDDLNLL